MAGPFQIQSYEQAHVTPLSGSSLTIAANVVSLTGRDLELVLDQAVASGAAVRVEARNWVMLGEVLYCVQERGRHKTRLRLEHALPSLKELADLSRHFFGQTARAPLAERDGYSGWT